jgi:NhaA family Na+:H+ antiporter
MPVFAFANAGVRVVGGADELIGPVTAAVLVGLLLGKPIGITLACWLGVRGGIARLPTGTSWAMIHGASWLGGIGFTMSLFVAALAFGLGPNLIAAKLGILIASLCAGIVGAVILRRATLGAGPGQ